MNKSIYNSVLDLIGNTPIVKLQKIGASTGHHFYAKLEYLNPGGSVKDRIAVSIIEEAEKRGDLKPGGTIIEATSGNTGLGLAMVAVMRGYKAIFVMPDKISEEKRAILRAYGAKVVITPTAVEPEDPRSYLSVAKKLVEITANSFYANQYHNPDNPQKHYQMTGPEIWAQMGSQLDAFVAGAGTGGTISGVGAFLKEKNPQAKIVLADPVGSILFDLFHHKEVRTPPASYKVEGVGEDMLPDNVHFKVMDDAIQVEDKAAFAMTRELVQKEGLCVGPSSGMALVAALEYAKKLKKPSHILVLFPDSGRSYLSKAFNDAWLRDNGFLPSPLKAKNIGDLLSSRAREAHQLITVDVGESVRDVVTKMKEAGVSQVPVLSNGQVIGILDESDLLEPLVRGTLKPTEPVIHLVKGSVVFLNITDDLSTLNDHLLKGFVALIKEGQKHHIITKIDLLQYLGDIDGH